MRSPLHPPKKPWGSVTVAGVVYRVYQLELLEGQFTIGGELYAPGRRWYGAGSWLVQGPDDEYARPMTDAEFQAFAAKAA